MRVLKVGREEMQPIFENLRRDYNIIAPFRKRKAGVFSDADIIIYDEVNSFDEIEFSLKSYYSAKSFLFPIREAMFKFYNNQPQEDYEKIRPMIIFLRACDINAISIMDAHFLKDSNHRDIYYERRREIVKFFLMECVEPFQNCFCVSMGTNKTEDYSVFVRKVNNSYEMKVKDRGFENFFPLMEQCKVEPRFVEKDLNPIGLPERINTALFENTIWQEYSLRCIACGRCNVSCPTCTCFTIQDISAEEKADAGNRGRIWSSCQVKKFALLAGNHNFRVSKGDRMRYRVLHKISDFKKRTGLNMCVGCGRCDDVCPEYISMFKCIEKINEITR